MSFSLSFFSILLLLVTDNFGKFPSVAFKVLHEQTGQFSEPLVPGIRLLTGSKVHTATASTFTRGEGGGVIQGQAPLQRQSGFVDRKCKHRESDVDANWRNGRV